MIHLEGCLQEGPRAVDHQPVDLRGVVPRMDHPLAPLVDPLQGHHLELHQSMCFKVLNPSRNRNWNQILNLNRNLNLRWIPSLLKMLPRNEGRQAVDPLGTEAHLGVDHRVCEDL